jgi:hypothetical protein
MLSSFFGLIRQAWTIRQCVYLNGVVRADSKDQQLLNVEARRCT